jgi:DinB superfamily
MGGIKMSELLFKNIEVTRNYFLKNIEALDESIIDVQPEGFNNTIHWHIGHVLTVTEQFIFGYPKKSANLPANYMEFFAKDTKPADWQGEVPSLNELSAQLKDQQKRMKEVPAESLKVKLQKPLLGLETFGEVANFSLFHETLHLGQIQAMKRVILAAQAK